MLTKVLLNFGELVKLTDYFHSISLSDRQPSQSSTTSVSRFATPESGMFGANNALSVLASFTYFFIRSTVGKWRTPSWLVSLSTNFRAA
ncbi:unnamed protein product [Phytophthora lilii]|uniref:Unnamed protein product n=1 Tax=Phytophthora lilii TaxID=2077276 RepID=A0A9W6UA02_9STRA|nr:unnamed protein product [Phytophthora lilii]